MLKRSRVKLVESEIVTYPTTKMMRNLLVAQVCALTGCTNLLHLVDINVTYYSLNITCRWILKTRNCVWWRPTLRVVKAMLKSGWSSCEWWCRGWERHLTMSPSCLGETPTWETLRLVIGINTSQFIISRQSQCITNTWSGLYIRWPRWVYPPVSVMSGSDWANRSTAATHGTPKLTTTRLYPMSVGAALTGSTSAQQPGMEFHIWSLTTWPWWDWKNWTVAATLVITGESTVASLLSRNAKQTETCCFSSESFSFNMNWSSLFAFCSVHTTERLFL